MASTPTTDNERDRSTEKESVVETKEGGRGYEKALVDETRRTDDGH